MNDFFDNNNNNTAATCESLGQACPLLEEILNTDRENEQWKDDATWILTSSFVILTMQSGFGLLEIGSSTPGNEVNTMLKNVADIIFGALAFYFVGYGIAYGEPSIPFMGLGDFLPDGQTTEDAIDSGVLYSRYLFQLSFAATSATIVSGCIAMRMKFEVYCGFAFYAVVVYSFVAHWVWADNGWLLTLGFHDFAGGSAVHLHGGVNGLIAILFVGSRRGRFDGSRPESDFQEASPTSMLFGLFMLWWGWIGFNCGSTFGITDDKWLVAARAGVNTINASAGGGVAAMVYSKINSKGKFIKPPDVVNGILGALVASSPTCAAVHTYDSLIIGAIGSLLACWTNDTLIKKWIKLDDPVGALGVHGMGGIWGCLAVSLFGDSALPGVDLVSDGLFRGGGFQLMGIQIMGMLAIAGWSIVTMPLYFYLVGICFSRDWKNPRKGLRYEFDQMDPILHGCTEDPREAIHEEITKAFDDVERRQGLQRMSTMRQIMPPGDLERTNTMIIDTISETSSSNSSSTQQQQQQHEEQANQSRSPSSSSKDVIVPVEQPLPTTTTRNGGVDTNNQSTVQEHHQIHNTATKPKLWGCITTKH